MKQFQSKGMQNLLLTVCIHFNDNACSKSHTTECLSFLKKSGAHMGSPYIFAIPSTPIFLLKMKTKLWCILKGVHSAS